MARPPYKPRDVDRMNVQHWAGWGVTAEAMCRRLGLGSVKTLKKHFAIELAKGRDELMVVALHGARKALREGSAKHLQLFLMNNRDLGIRTSDRLELTGADGSPLSLGPPPVLQIWLVGDEAAQPGQLGHTRQQLRCEAAAAVQAGDLVLAQAKLGELKALLPADEAVTLLPIEAPPPGNPNGSATPR